MRIAINTGVALGILSFFTGDSLTGLVAGAVFIGIANAGGDLAWSLWVTKVAPAERTAEYMTVHTFLTGVRGVLAPFAGFYLLQILPVWTVAAISISFNLAASILLIPEARAAKFARPTTPLSPKADVNE
jgi:MFS family permease